MERRGRKGHHTAFRDQHTVCAGNFGSSRNKKIYLRAYSKDLAVVRSPMIKRRERCWRDYESGLRKRQQTVCRNSGGVPSKNMQGK